MVNIEHALTEIRDYLGQNDIFTLDTFSLYGEGLITTLQLVSLSLLFGLIIALPLAILRTSTRWYINKPIWLFTYLFRGTPLLIQLYLIYFGVVYIKGIQESMFWPIVRDAFYPCLLAFMLNTCAYTTEIFRGVLMTTPASEIEAGRAYGMSKWQILMRIKVPSACRRVIPAYANEVIFMLHASAIASTVTIMDLTGAARLVYSRFYAPFEAFLMVAAIYLAITFVLVLIFRKLEHKYLAHLR